MSSGSFDCLSSLGPDLSNYGNEAESLIENPRLCFVTLRAWLEAVIDFLDEKHSIPELPVIQTAKGDIQRRIPRLPEHGVRIEASELKALDDLRLIGNDGSHPLRKRHRFTRANAEIALNNARLIRDWLYDEYVRQPSPAEPAARPNASGAFGSAAAPSPPKSNLRSTSFAEEAPPSRRPAVPSFPERAPTNYVGLKLLILGAVLFGLTVFYFRQQPTAPGVTQASGLKSPSVTVTGLDKNRNIIPSSNAFPPNSTVLIEATYTSAIVNRDEMQINVDWSNGSAACDKTLLQSVTGTVRCEIDDLKEGFYTVTVLGGKRKLWEVNFNVELPTVRYDGKQIATFRNGELQVTLTNEPDQRRGKRAIAVGKYQDRPAFVLRSELGGTTSALKFLRIDPTSNNSHVIFSSFSGGAHCCTETKFASADTQGNWYVVNGRVIDGEIGYEFKDLDGDGVYELISGDNDFLYAFGCYACSTMPARIEKLVGPKFVNVTRDTKYQKFLREVLKRMEARSDSNSRSNGYLGGWVASKSLVGELDDAWRKMLASYNPSPDEKTEECLINVPLTACPADQKRELTFPEALLKLLVRNGYVTQGQATTLPTVPPKQPLNLVPENKIADAVGTAPQPQPDVNYGSRCLPGQISSRARCLQIPPGAVDFSLDAGDMFTLPAGEVGYLTAVSGGIFVRNSQTNNLEYLLPGKRKLVVTTDIMKAETNGTRAEYRPVQ